MPAGEDRLDDYGWRAAAAAAAGVFVSFASLLVYTFGVFLKSLTETFGWSREAVSAAFGIATMTVAVCSPALGMRSGTQANSTIGHRSLRFVQYPRRRSAQTHFETRGWWVWSESAALRRTPLDWVRENADAGTVQSHETQRGVRARSTHCALDRAGLRASADHSAVSRQPAGRFHRAGRSTALHPGRRNIFHREKFRGRGEFFPDRAGLQLLVDWRFFRPWIQPYAPSGSCRDYNWTPSSADVGDHALQVWVRNAGSASAYDTWAGTSIFRVVVDPLGMPALSSDVVFPVPANTPVTWRASVAGGVPSLRYQFFVLRSGVGWSLLQDYSTVPIAVWTPPATGTYVVQLTVRNAGTTTGYDTYTNSGYITVGSDSPARIATIGSDVHLPAQAGARITWTAVASGGTAGPLQFQFVRLNERTGIWTVVQPYASSNQFAWNTTAADVGSYVIQVWVRSAGSSAAYEDWGTTGSFTLQ